MISNADNKTVKSFTINMASLNSYVPSTDIEEDPDFQDYENPPLRAAFGAKFNQQVMFVENSRRDIPYPDEVPLTPSRRCDCIEVPEMPLLVPSKATTYHVTSHDVQAYVLASLGTWNLIFD